MPFRPFLKTLAFASAFVVIMPSQAEVDGDHDHLASELNTAFQTVVESCGAGAERPAHECSGLLLRTVERGAEPFWKHSEVAAALGAEAAVYLRGDLGIQMLPQPHGAILLSAVEAEQTEKAVEPLCIYPFTLAQQGDWTSFGCLSPNIARREETDLSSCAGLGVVDAPGWVDFFRSVDTVPERQCSLSTRDTDQFGAALRAHGLLGSSWSRQPTVVMIRNWDDSLPGRLPFRGLFYLAGQREALLGAQEDQRSYFQHTGLWLPVLRVNLTQHDGRIFSFHPDEQLSIGFEIADRLNHRFADVGSTCADGSAAFNCRGVLIRGTEASSTHHAWNLRPYNIDDNVVSFSYLRRDISIGAMFRNHGMVFKPLAEPAEHPVTLRCAYPVEAGTGGPGDDCAVEIRCDTLDITSYRKWLESTPNIGLSCPFAPTPEQFQLSIDVRASRPDSRIYNEILLAAWPNDIPAQLPIEAFIYQTDTPDGLPGAQFIQRDYFNETGRFLPVLRVRFAATDQMVFVYELAEQLQPGQSLAP